jgi:hypothetical protein
MNFDKIELGTPETAVKSCVNLLSRLFEQPEDYVACYLDLYYQVRRRWEESETPSGAARQLPQGGSQGGGGRRADEGIGPYGGGGDSLRRCAPAPSGREPGDEEKGRSGFLRQHRRA